MAGYLEHSARWQHHQQPRRVDYTRPGFARPPDPVRVPDCHWSADGVELHAGADPASCGDCVNRCRTCGGAGVIDTTPEGARHPAMQSDTACPACSGTGERSGS